MNPSDQAPPASAEMHDKTYNDINSSYQPQSHGGGAAGPQFVLFVPKEDEEEEDYA